MSRNLSLDHLAHEISDASLRLLLDLTDIGIMITDLDHRTVAVNNAFGRIFEIDPSKATSLSVEELRSQVYPRLKNKELWLLQLETIYADPLTLFEDEIELLGQVNVVVRRRTHPLRNQDGEPIGRVWTFRDVTCEQMRLKQLQAMDAVNNLHNPDPNQVCRQIVTWVAEVFDSSCILSIRSGDNLLFREKVNVPSWIPNIRENLVKDAYCQFALESLQPHIVQDADEQPDLYVHILPFQIGLKRYAGVPLCDSNGEALGTLCILDDRTRIPITAEDMTFLSVMASRIVTELEREKLFQQRTAEQKRQLVRQEEELAETHRVLTAMNEAFELLGKNLKPRQVLASQTKLLQGLLGYESARLLYRKGKFAIGIDSHKDVTKATRINLSEFPYIAAGFERSPADFKQVVVSDHEYLTIVRLPIEGPDPYLLMLGSAIPAPVEDERHVTHLLAIVEQVSLLMTASRLNEDLRKAHHDLSEAQSRLIQSEKLSVVGALSASIAHDIRNILASISIECSMQDQDPAQTLATVRNQVDRFSVLSHRLLSYAKPRFLARELIDLNSILERAVNLLATQIRVTGAEFSLFLEPNLSPVLADSHRVEHLFVNLILNSLQAMSSQGGYLSLSSRVVNDAIVIEVADNGNGMSSETSSRVFEPFYSTRKDGFGLGLYSCHKIAEEHDWSLTVYSEIGVGSTFCLTVPFRTQTL